MQQTPISSQEKSAVANTMPNAKQPICITSSSDNIEEDDQDEEESDSYQGQDDESEYNESESDQKGDEESDWSSAEDEDYDSLRDWMSSEEQSDEDDDDLEGCDQKEGKGIDEDLCDKVVNLLRQRNKKLDVLKLDECKAYLRKHDLMISGTKATCIQRILEHWRLKDGNSERLYPKSSFTINCTGDVCKGDVVTFQQRVYDKFNKVSRNGKVIGKRTIAGRVVKESYGSEKQQHTFTVEILWSRGVKPLSLLYPLRVKGRNLYRYRTFRQRWGNEAERSKVLEEKHRRGATARHVRASTKAIISAGSKRRRNLTDSQQKHQIKPPKKNKKHSHPPTPQKKLQKISHSRPHLKNSSYNKHISISSSSNHSNTSKSKISLNTKRIQTDHSERKANALHFPTKKPNFQYIFHNSPSDFHQRSKLSAPQTGNERFLIPAYNYYSQNAAHGIQMMNGGENIHHSRSVYASRFDRRGDSSHPYSSSGHFFAPGACDQRFAGFQFHGRSQFWP